MTYRNNMFAAGEYGKSREVASGFEFRTFTALQCRGLRNGNTNRSVTAWIDAKTMLSFTGSRSTIEEVAIDVNEWLTRVINEI